MKKALFALCLLVAGTAGQVQAQDFILTSDRPATLYNEPEEEAVVHTALDIFGQDCRNVLGAAPEKASLKKADIIVGTISDPDIRRWAEAQHISLDSLERCHEGFLLQVIAGKKKNTHRLAVLGSDKRGTAYGLMTLSRLMGVSPWEWWADCTPTTRDTFKLSAGFRQLEAPTVPYRGIFINDEDWGLTPWASKNYEPKMRGLNGEDPAPRKGDVGPYTHARIFELLLRLRANVFWPAMHTCSVPFYLTPGNRETAARYGILVSTSHCEPMMRNTNGEWSKAGKGSYNFITNPDNVTRFWEERVEEMKGIDCIYTLGMRGVHDGAMQGAKGAKAQTEVLRKVLKTQRNLLSRHINADMTQVPQQFIPYKEVLDCYRNGLEVPDDVTLIWCDDNYGYVRYSITDKERARKGGNGIYYHISYWGRPHDYLWLATTHPELLYSEMYRAYQQGIRHTWVLNVGDIKPGEYLTSLFLDMAWDIDRINRTGLDRHLTDWYTEQTGVDGRLLAPLWKTYYDLSLQCRPEHLGGTRVEEKDPKYKLIADLPMNEQEIRTRLAQCDRLEREVSALSASVPANRRDAWFQLVEYPIRSLAAINQKMLNGQLARHRLADWQPSHEAYNRIVSLTQTYNSLNNGKWQGMMSHTPRNLAVFKPLEETTLDTPMPEGTTGTILWADPASAVGKQLKPGETFTFRLPETTRDTLQIEIRTLPVHPSDDTRLRYAARLDDGQETVLEFQTKGRSEEWKQNVLRNYARRTLTLPVSSNASKGHQLHIRALDEGVTLQAVVIK